jgi:hypothetical protein
MLKHYCSPISCKDAVANTDAFLELARNVAVYSNELGCVNVDH